MNTPSNILKQTVANDNECIELETKTLQADFNDVFAELEYARGKYLDFMEKVIAGTIYKDASRTANTVREYNHQIRENGLDWPIHAHSMVGMKRLKNTRLLTESVIGNNIPGDLIETGVWRGGASILMRAVLDTYGIKNRKVFVADSFEGLPKPNTEKYPMDVGSVFYRYADLSVPLDVVKENFASYNLLDEQVVFVKGWFKDTLPHIETNTLSLMRLDGDMYESTIDALVHLYDKLSVGGYVIIDDYHMVPECKQAVSDFCTSKNIVPRIQEIDDVGVFWQKENS